MNIRTLGALCMLGALYKIGITLGKDSIDNTSSLFYALWALHLICVPLLMAGPVGLWHMGAFGDGRKVLLGKIGTGVALLGLAGITLSVFIFLNTRVFSPILIGLPTILSAAGMLLLGIATFAAKRLHGWHAWMPLVIGLVYFAQLVPQAALGLGQGNRAPEGWMISIWWAAWLALGYSLFDQQTKRTTVAT